MNQLNIEALLSALNTGRVRYLLIGGANFMIRHIPLLTYDVDVWVDDQEENLSRLSIALNKMGAQWGPTEESWQIVPSDSNWLKRQMVFCMTTPLGALDVFRDLRGLEGQFEKCFSQSVPVKFASGIIVQALSDQDMLQSQLALAPHEQNPVKVETLRKAIASGR